MAVNSLTNRALHSRHRTNVSVIVGDIVVDRGSIFARERIIDVFIPRTRTTQRTADVLHFRLRFVRYVRRTPRRTLLLLLEEEEEEKMGAEEDNAMFSRH